MKIPDHQHKHSVYTRCLNCFMWGINLPNEIICGNCQSTETVLYSPPCCIIADRNSRPKQWDKTPTVLDYMDPFDWDE